ncbi:MAG: HutP family protein [Bacteroidota bacterium]
MTVRRIMDSNLVTVEPDTPTGELRRIMLNSGTNLLLVTEAGQAIGIISDRDLLTPAGRDALVARDVMDTRLIKVSDECTVSEACSLLNDSNAPALAVLDGEGMLVGIVSPRDIVKGMAEDEGATTISVEAASIYLVMTRSREYEKYWLEKVRGYGYKGAITQVGASADRLAAKLRESMIAAAVALGVISEDVREKIAVSNAVRDAYVQLSMINPGLGGGFKMAVVRGDGRVSVAIFGRFGHALVDGPEQLAVGYSVI